ncbi:hypothetical protein ACFWFZ_17755 [Streptomyces sp. NPDC060232]|uniref:hypothetical protein n=1 Tax=Streptomyces sp. NPDC060232 TaxID=3347079 RepID=UPI00364A8509
MADRLAPPTTLNDQDAVRDVAGLGDGRVLVTRRDVAVECRAADGSVLWTRARAVAVRWLGVGSAQLRQQLAQCDRLGQPAYLESSNITNIPFCEGLGFRVTGEIRLPGGGPTLWPMRREPARADDRNAA